MPALPLVDSMRAVVVHKFYTDVLEISYFGEDDPAPDDAYMYRALVNGVMVTDTLYEWSFTDDRVFNGQRAYDEPVLYLDQEVEQYVVWEGDRITLETSHIPHEYYLFLYDAYWEYQGADPFGGNPANIRTNISGPRKAWGFFTTYAIDRKEKILKMYYE